MTPSKEREYMRRWRAQNPEKVRAANLKWKKANAEKNREYARSWSAANPEKSQARSRRWREENQDRLRSREQVYRENNQERIKRQHREYHERNRNNPHYRLRRNLRKRLYTAIRGDQKTGSAVRDLGISIPEFRRYIEAQFEPGMSWENWSRSGWHLDHIKPLASFDLTDRKQLLEACHYTNLRPLWAVDNLRRKAG